MGRIKQILNKLLFPGIAIVLTSVPIAAALLTYTFLYEEEYSPVAYVSYVISAYSLTIVCACIAKFPKERFKIVLHRNQYVHLYLTDVPFKTHVSLYLSLGINLLFAAMNLFMESFIIPCGLVRWRFITLCWVSCVSRCCGMSIETASGRM